MYLDKRKLIDYMNSRFEGNYSKFAKELKVEVAQLHRIINTGSQAGTVFLGRLHTFCKNSDIQFEDFIFFD